MKYEVGHIITNNCVWMGAYPRELIAEDGHIVGIVDSCTGPAILGSMTAKQVLAAFGYKWVGADVICREAGDDESLTAYYEWLG